MATAPPSDDEDEDDDQAEDDQDEDEEEEEESALHRGDLNLLARFIAPFARPYLRLIFWIVVALLIEVIFVFEPGRWARAS